MTFHQLRRGDVVLLCSDGLSRVVSDGEIHKIVTNAEDCLAICERLIALANTRGGPDNITVVVARVDGDGVSSEVGAEAPMRRVYAGRGAGGSS
jgi:protein phosphatase